MPRRLEPPPNDSYRIVCPYCFAQEYFLISHDYSVATCSSCGGKFRVLIATVRGKRGRRSYTGREYLIRTVMREGEREISLIDGGYSNLDLRSSDLMYICYKFDQSSNVEKNPTILCNLTINQYVKIEPTKGYCIIATVSCGYDSWEVKELSNFRDNVLLRNGIGFLMIRFYYRFSPYFATYLLEKPRLKQIARKFIVSPIAVSTSKLFRSKFQIRSKENS
jgi:hypothetical protein